MAKFITDYLSQLVYDTDCSFKSDDFRYGPNDGNILNIIGRIRSGLATFTITLCRLDRTSISSIPVFDTPLNENTIREVVAEAEARL